MDGNIERYVLGRYLRSTEFICMQKPVYVCKEDRNKLYTRHRKTVKVPCPMTIGIIK